MLFKDYAIKNVAGHITGRQGELASLISKDNDFPECNDLRQINQYMDHNKPYHDYQGTPFRMMWANFIRDEKSGANADAITADRYRDMLSLCWKGFKRAMRHADLDKRLQVWDEAMDYYHKHMAVDCPEFAADVMKVFKDELIRGQGIYHS